MKSFTKFMDSFGAILLAVIWMRRCCLPFGLQRIRPLMR